MKHDKDVPAEVSLVLEEDSQRVPVVCQLCRLQQMRKVHRSGTRRMLKVDEDADGPSGNSLIDSVIAISFIFRGDSGKRSSHGHRVARLGD